MHTYVTINTFWGTYGFIVLLAVLSVIPMIFLAGDDKPHIWWTWAFGLFVAPPIAGQIAIAWLKANQYNYFEAGVRTYMPVEVQSNIVCISMFCSILLGIILVLVVLGTISAICIAIANFGEDIEIGKSGKTREQWERAKRAAYRASVAKERKECRDEIREFERKFKEGKV